MKEKILQSLRKIEQDNNIKVLFACETGSRAWGFASPDSDYDVRFIYMHNKDWYLSLNEQKDSIELMLDNGELDITGWDLRKSLRLLKKSNISLFERFKSPEIYLNNNLFISELNDISDNYFSSISGMHHYLNMAKGFYEKCMENNTVKLKSYFYALRSALSCIWIMKNKSMPPIEFSKLIYLFTCTHLELY